MLHKASALLCLSVVLAACGGGEETPTNHTRSASAAAEAPSETSTPGDLPVAIHRSWEAAAALNRAEVQQTADAAPSDASRGPATKAFAAPSAPLYRFYNIQTGAHLLTRDLTERDRTLNTLPQFRYEGAVFAAWSASAAGLSPVYRFYNTTTGTHFFTISETERNTLQATRPDLLLEGVAYHASKTAASGTTALYRFYHRQRGYHFYTASAAERDSIIANLATTYQYEGVGYYVNATVGTYDRAPASLAGKANSYGNNNALGEDARFGLLRGMAFNPTGDLFVIDYESYGPTSTTRLDPEIRRISPAGLVTSFAGSWQARYSYANGIGSGIAMDGIRAITFDAAGNMYFGDGRTVRIINTGVSSSTIAGSLSASGYINGQAQSARFSDIQGIARDSQGNIFVSDTANHSIRMVSISGVVTTFAGADPTVASYQRAGYSDGVGTAARFRSPTQMAVDAADNLYVADQGNHRIRRITPAGEVTTLAGQSDADVVDGQGTSAKFDSPFAMAIDRSTGNLYVSDWDGCTVRRVTPAGNVTTVAGTPYNCGVFFGSLPAGVSSVGGLAVRNGRLYIASLNGIYWTNLP